MTPEVAAFQPTEDDIRQTREMANHYRSRGFNPLPSSPKEKRPLIKYREFWEKPCPSETFDRFQTTNIQLVTGVQWGLLVIDLDGPEAIEWFHGLGHKIPITWTVTSGGNGRHLWFRIPKDRKPLGKAILWQGGGKHSAVERLCDRSLIMAPPSIHPTTGQKYRFVDKMRSPKGMPLPAPCPAWILSLPPIRPERTTSEVVTLPLPRLERLKLTGRYHARDVLASIPDKTSLVASWGLRLVGSRGDKIACRAIGRDDQNPSAEFYPDKGQYWDAWLSDGRAISLFELGVRLGVYSDWTDAVADLGNRYCPHLNRIGE